MENNIIMTNEDITNYQKNLKAFRQTNIGKLFYQYVAKQQRAERYDAQMEFTDSGSLKKLTEYWKEANTAEESLLKALYELEGMEYVGLRTSC